MKYELRSIRLMIHIVVSFIVKILLNRKLRKIERINVSLFFCFVINDQYEPLQQQLRE